MRIFKLEIFDLFFILNCELTSGERAMTEIKAVNFFNRKILSVSCTLFLMISPLVALADPPNITLKGWSELKETVKSQPANKISELNGRTFKLELTAGAHSLRIYPEESFEISSADNSYTVKVVNASALIASDVGGLVFKRELKWDASISDSDAFGINISGINECIFNLSFVQDGGTELDLTALKNFYSNVTWSFDDPSVVESSEITGKVLQVRRKYGNNSNLNVTLWIKDSTKNIDVRSKPISVQKCASFIKDNEGNEGVIQIRTPGQCVVKSFSKEDEFKTASTRGINYQVVYNNTCDKPIVCNISWRHYKYDSVADGINRLNGIQTSIWSEEITLGALASNRSEFYLEAPLGFPYYSWTNPWLPDSAFPGFKRSDFLCKWKEAE